MDASIMTATTASAIVIIIMIRKTLTGHTNGSSK